MEYFDLYTYDRKPLGKKILRGSQIPRGAYHLVVQIMTINKNGEILLTQRAQGKSSAGKWECTGGCAVAGETAKQAAARELFEETGISVDENQLSYAWSLHGDSMLLDFFITWQDARLESLRLQPAEVSAAKWVSFERMAEMVRAGQIIPTVSKWFYVCQDQLRRCTAMNTVN